MYGGMGCLPNACYMSCPRKLPWFSPCSCSLCELFTARFHGYAATWRPDELFIMTPPSEHNNHCPCSQLMQEQNDLFAFLNHKVFLKTEKIGTSKVSSLSKYHKL
jgi:hypothetical protein